MSNPAVIIIAETLTEDGKSFRIEDNIGEAIHIHYKDLRLDFTIEKFLLFAQIVEESIDALVAVDGFAVAEYDAIFLSSLSDSLLELESVEICDIDLTDLEVFVDTAYGPRLQTLPNSMMFQALTGNTERYKSYKQVNSIGMSNMERLSGIVKFIGDVEYPHLNNHIVIFNEGKIIRDGQHRAAAMLFLEKNGRIPVKRLIFRDGRNDIVVNPVRCFLIYCVKRPVLRLLANLLQFINRVARKLKRCFT